MNRSPSLLALFICALALPGLAGCGSKSSPSDNGSGSTSSPALDGGVLNCSVSVESGDYDYSVTNNTLTITVDGQSQAPLTRIGAAPSSPTYPLLGSWQEPQSITNGLQISIALTFTESTPHREQHLRVPIAQGAGDRHLARQLHGHDLLDRSVR